MVGVRKSRSHLIAVCVIQNILNLNVALLFIRIIGQRARDLIRELIRRIPGLIRNRIGFLCLFFLLDLLGLFGRLCCITRRRIGRVTAHRTYDAGNNEHHDDTQNDLADRLLSLFCHYASFLRSGYRAGTQHIVGGSELKFISWELMSQHSLPSDTH